MAQATPMLPRQPQPAPGYTQPPHSSGGSRNASSHLGQGYDQATRSSVPRSVAQSSMGSPMMARQQTPFTNAGAVSQFQAVESSPQFAEVPIDPVRALEAKVYALQCQLDTLDSRDCCSASDNANVGNSGGIYFGAGAIFAKPHLKESFQYSQINLATGRQTLVPFEYDYQSTLRGWVGYRSPEGFGVKVTYWGFDDEGRTSVNTADGTNIYGASAVTVIFPANIFAIAPGETLTSTDFLKTQIINYYGTYQTKVGNFEVDGAMGLRYARLLQSLDSFVTPPNSSVPIRRLTWERKYDGLGPAISVDVKRRIGCSGFSVVGQGGGRIVVRQENDQSDRHGGPKPAASDTRAGAGRRRRSRWHRRDEFWSRVESSIPGWPQFERSRDLRRSIVGRSRCANTRVSRFRRLWRPG